VETWNLSIPAGEKLKTIKTGFSLYVIKTIQIDQLYRERVLQGGVEIVHLSTHPT
jgi:hypothetical protein